MKKINKLRLFVILAIIASLIGLSYFTIINFNKKIREDKLADIKKQDNNLEEVEKETSPVNITISAAGDVTMGNYKGGSYYGSFDQEFQNQNGNFSYFFENVKSVFESDDLSIVNLEGPLLPYA